MTLYALDGIEPSLDATCWVAPSADLIGRVIVRENASVWFGVVARGDNEPIEIGPGANVQENVVLHTDMGYPLTIGENATIGHKAMLHGCQIAPNTLIGMGATILNGAKIGTDCVIGAGALIGEGKEIPDGSLVMGMPGRIVRETDSQTRTLIRALALGYQENLKRYRDGLKPIQMASRPLP